MFVFFISKLEMENSSLDDDGAVLIFVPREGENYQTSGA